MSVPAPVSLFDLGEYTFIWVLLCAVCYLGGKWRGRIETLREIDKPKGKS